MFWGIGCAVARVGLSWGAWFAIVRGAVWLVARFGLVALWCNDMREAGLMQGLQFHSCAVRSSGAVSCWGNNAYGQVIAFAGLRWGCMCTGI